MQKGRRRSGAIISNCCTPTRPGKCREWSVGRRIYFQYEDATCGILRLMQGILRNEREECVWCGVWGEVVAQSFIWQPTRPHNYRYRVSASLHAPHFESPCHTLTLLWQLENPPACNLRHLGDLLSCLTDLSDFHLSLS